MDILKFLLKLLSVDVQRFVVDLDILQSIQVKKKKKKPEIQRNAFTIKFFVEISM